MTEFVSTQKFLLMSPKKIRVVVEMIKSLSPAKAVETLPYVPQRAAADVAKAIKTALANAKATGVGEEDLKFKEIQINEGPRLKRGRAASRGRWHPYKRRMSHIRVVLETTKTETKSKPKVGTQEFKQKTKKGAKKSVAKS